MSMAMWYAKPSIWATPLEVVTSVHCVAQACEDILFFEAAAIEWQVTYPVNFPPSLRR